MGFLKRLFGGDKENKKTGYVDKTGIYFYVECDNCGTCVRLRADKEHDLVREDNGFTWHKTIVDSRCFRPMPTVVVLNSKYEISDSEITGGKYISEAEYNTWLKRKDEPEEIEEPDETDAVVETNGSDEIDTTEEPAD